MRSWRKWVAGMTMAVICILGVLFMPQSAVQVMADEKQNMGTLNLNWDLEPDKMMKCKDKMVVKGEVEKEIRLENYKITDAEKEGYKELSFECVFYRKHMYDLTSEEAKQIVNSEHWKMYENSGENSYYTIVDFESGKCLEENNDLRVTVTYEEKKDEDDKVYCYYDENSYLWFYLKSKMIVKVIFPENYTGLCIGVGGTDSLYTNEEQNEAFWNGEIPFWESRYYVADDTGYAHFMRVDSNIHSEYFNGHEYKYFEGDISWYEAKEKCEELGGHLVVISSKEEQEFINSYVENLRKAGTLTKQNIWIGANIEDGALKWVADEGSDYTNWSAGEPNNVYSMQDCVMMYTALSVNGELGFWNDESGEGRNWEGYTLDDIGYICEWSESTDASENTEFFKLEEDTNRFIHYGLPYKITDSSYKSQLYTDSLLTWDGTIQLSKYLNSGDDKKGVCHGIALSMCYGDQGYINFDKVSAGADNYWGLGEPLNNSKMSDMIVYYHLTQLTANGGATKTVDKNGWHISKLENRLEKFLTSFIDEAKKGEEEQCPFVFSFKYTYKGEIEGHSVVVCGYNWNVSTNCHEIKIYDENSYDGNSAGDYIIMTIPKDCKSFDFADANAVEEKYKIQDVWTNLSYYGMDKIYNSINTIRLSDRGEKKAVSENKTTLQITAGKKFRLENTKGEWLQYDGSNYTGTMVVYDCYSNGINGSMVWNITVDESLSFKLAGAESGCELICTIGEQGYAVTADGADSVMLTADKIDVQGAEYVLSVAIESDSCDFIQLDAEVTGDVSIVNDSGIKVEFVGDGENMTVSTYKDIEMDVQDVNSTVDEIVLDDTGEVMEIIPSDDVIKNGLRQAEDGNWYYYADGVVDTSFTGLYNDIECGWWLVQNGKVAFDYTGLWYDQTYGWWLIGGGSVCFDYTGLWNDPNYGWWLIGSGTVAFDYTGLWNDPNCGWWLIGGGSVCFDYTGLWNDPNCGWWLIGSGTVAFDYTGLWNDPNCGWWLIGGGSVCFDYTGLWNDPNYGWWLIGSGTVAFDYTGLWNDSNYGWWYVKNGAINFGYTGQVYYDGVPYHVVNGQLV